MLSPKSAIWLRVALAILYPLLAHLASDQRNDMLAALALGDIALIVLWRPLLSARAWAWAAIVVIAVGLAGLARSPYALLCLMLVPVALIGLVGYVFGRTLRTVPLITRMVAGLDGVAPAELTTDLRRYTRNLTLSWTALLIGLALLNLVFALLVVPDGILAVVGIAAPLTLTQSQWSWFAALNFPLMIGFFLAEFAVRQRRFPGRYKNLLDFLRRMSWLGPAFWRDVVH